MRTDSTFLVPEFEIACQEYIEKTWGKPYLACGSRATKEAKHAQEAHEAIRPTDIQWHPTRIHGISEPLAALYKLIWDRTVASQMASSQYEQKTLILSSTQGENCFRTTVSHLTFDGFLSVYEEGKEEEETPEKGLSSFPSLEIGTSVYLSHLEAKQHFTQPPPRYSEASLIKNLEELGVGRPSTYARILKVLQDRGYVSLEKKRFMPKELGIVVAVFLEHFFPRYMDYQFTAQMETQLDSVSLGNLPWKEVVSIFWEDFSPTVQAAYGLKISEVLQSVEEDIFIFTTQRQCRRCEEGRLSLRLSKVGPFLACDRYPECTYSANFFGTEQESLRELGLHPQTSQPVSLKKGPYGWYVEHQDKRATLPSSFAPDILTLEQATWLLSLPKRLGEYEAEEVLVGIGRFGPYIKHGERFIALKGLSLEETTFEQAVNLIEKSKTKTPRRKTTETVKKASGRPKKKSASAKKSPSLVSSSPVVTS